MAVCQVYRCPRRDYTYVFLRDGLELHELPEKLAQLFEGAERVLQLDLSPDRSLAQEDVRQVMKNLSERGWHLQLPPEDDPSGWLDLPRQDRG